MKNKKLTVIIPAFNAGRYIEKCINSVINQNKADETISVIVVIDGATDDTLEKSKNISEKHGDLIELIIQKNRGPSAARNNGLSKANTEYVTFLDADDFWNDDYLKNILEILESSPDLIEYDASRVCENGEILNTIKISHAEEGDIKEIKKDEFSNIFRCYSWARVYKTSLVKNHLFPEDRRFEDTATTPWHYWNSKKTISIGKTLVGYRQHSTSILATPRIEDIYEISLCIREAVAMYEKTKSDYWQIVVYRIFHFACQRITTQSFKNWKKCINISIQAIGNVPPPKNTMRKIQRYATLTYIILLYTRYTTSNILEIIIPKKILRSMFPVR